MSNRRYRTTSRAVSLKQPLPELRSRPSWLFLSLLANGLLLTTLLLYWMRENHWSIVMPSFAKALPVGTAPGPEPPPELGPRHQLDYEQWVNLLAQEASVAAEKQPDHLTILLGDSLSLWFPTDLLMPQRNWLNQGISGETSEGLLQRLNLLEATKPQTVFVMIGINDLLRGVSDRNLLHNYRKIVRTLRQNHPETQIVVQAILPHGDTTATWEGRDRLLAVPNQRIRALNTELAAIASEQDAYYLDLNPLFTNPEGNLRMELSTDGLHLNQQGYLVWQTALQLYIQEHLAGKG